MKFKLNVITGLQHTPEILQAYSDMFKTGDDILDKTNL